MSPILSHTQIMNDNSTSVSSITDIATADSRRLREETFECKRIPKRQTRWEWPNQPHPTTENQKQECRAAMMSRHLITNRSKKKVNLRENGQNNRSETG